jgi:hypothetical protein
MKPIRNRRNIYALTFASSICLVAPDAAQKMLHETV